MKDYKFEKLKVFKKFVEIRNERFNDYSSNEIENLRNMKIFLGSKIMRMKEMYSKLNIFSNEIEYYIREYEKRYKYIENKIDRYENQLDMIRYDY